jgi:hypothetical protein
MAPQKSLTVFFRRTGEWALGAIDVHADPEKTTKNAVASTEHALSAMFPLNRVVILR